MRTWAVYLWPRGRSRPVHSDTLFGALCWAWRALHGRRALEQLLEGAADRPPFVVSSAFPTLRGRQGVIRTYPLPCLGVPHPGAFTGPSAAAERRDRIRKEMEASQGIRDLARSSHCSEAILGKITSGETVAQLWREQGAGTPGGVTGLSDILLTRSELEALPSQLRVGPLWTDRDIPRNHTNRVAGATVEGLLFSVTARSYAENAGLWFAYRAEELDPLLPLLRYLADTGIGGKRSVGLGHFSIPLDEIHETGIPGSESGHRFASLSRYVPESGEVDFENPQSSYRLLAWHPKHEARGAPPRQRIFKGRFWVMEEGSILVPREPGREFYGRCHPLGPATDHPGGFPVWHNGTTIPVFLPAEGDHA